MGGIYLCCPVPAGSVADEDMGRLLHEGVAHRAGRLEELTHSREPMGGVQSYQVVLIRTGGRGERERIREAKEEKRVTHSLFSIMAWSLLKLCRTLLNVGGSMAYSNWQLW